MPASGRTYIDPLRAAQLPTTGKSPASEGMSTVAEIESAIEKLSPQEQRELEAWYEERRALLNASDSLFRLYEDEERVS